MGWNNEQDQERGQWGATANFGILGGALNNRFGSSVASALGRNKKPPVPGPMNEFGLDRNSKNYAADTQAYMTRANWARTQSQLRPLIDSLNYNYFNPTGRREVVQEASALAGQGIAQAQQQFGRDARSTGISLAPDQQVEVGRQFASAGNMASLDAKNRASMGYTDRRNQIALG